LRARVAQWIAGGEIYEVEFKGELRERLNDRDLVEAVVCLANGTGGVLLVGVEDDGTAIGVRRRPDSDAAPVAFTSARMRRRPRGLSSASDGSSDRCPVTAVLAALKR
jgi:predicted HTH transcriptional regulator